MIGTKLAHYEITRHLGTGGMGEVYQATDSKLGRSVAIKLLPAAFAADAGRLSRFRREAQVLASLNHSNIAQIYGLEESGEKRCIVMELVEGETLQARIKRGPVPVAEALAIAKQIAEALEAAHEKGVVHRDLKPGNAYDIGALSLTDNKKTIPIAQTTFEERDGQFSPNGNWVAYRSNESGRLEVYVQAFPGPGEKKQISTNGGLQPRWSSDGKELFYIGLDSRLMNVPIRAGAPGQPLETGNLTALFTTRIALAPQRTVKHQYAVSRDGQRFLINSSPEDAVAAPITLILNWNSQQKK